MQKRQNILLVGTEKDTKHVVALCGAITAQFPDPLVTVKVAYLERDAAAQDATIVMFLASSEALVALYDYEWSWPPDVERMLVELRYCNLDDIEKFEGLIATPADQAILGRTEEHWERGEKAVLLALATLMLKLD